MTTKDLLHLALPQNLQSVNNAMSAKRNKVKLNKMNYAYIVILISICLSPVTGKKGVYCASPDPNTDVYIKSGWACIMCNKGGLTTLARL